MHPVRNPAAPVAENEEFTAHVTQILNNRRYDRWQADRKAAALDSFRDPDFVHLHRRRILNQAISFRELARGRVAAQLRAAKHVLTYDLSSGQLRVMLSDDAALDATLSEHHLKHVFVVCFDSREMSTPPEWLQGTLESMRRGGQYQPPRIPESVRKWMVGDDTEKEEDP